MTVKARHVPDRDSKYMGLAWMMAAFSKDPHTQVGALIVDPLSNIPLGWGYNGPPKSINDNLLDWSRPNKYDYMLHAEENAIFHTGCVQPLHDCTLYVTQMPCKRCMLRIGKVRIKRVVYSEPTLKKDSSLNLSAEEKAAVEKLAKECDITLNKFYGNLAWIEDWTLRMKALSVF